MQLPRAEFAEISEEKIKDYLLNSTHPDGAGKARFFQNLGFSLVEWSILAEALKNLAMDSEVSQQIESDHGTKFVVDGILPTPNGKLARIRTVWIVDRNSENPRLVTAYPLPGGK